MTSNKKNVDALNKVNKSLPLVKRVAKIYVKPYWKRLSVAMGLMLIAALMTGGMAKLMEPIIDTVFTDKDEAMLWPVALSVFGVFIFRGFSTYGYTVMMNKFGQQVVSDINRDMFSNSIYADLSFFEEVQSGQLVSRFVSDTTFLRAAVLESLIGIGKNSFTIIVLIGVMFYQDWKLSLISIFIFPTAAFIVGKLGKKLRKVSSEAQQEIGNLTSMLGQAFQGVKHVKSYCTEEHEKARVNVIIQRIFSLVYKSFRVSSITIPMSETLNGLAIVTIVVYGGYEVIEGASTAGKLFSFITAFMLAVEPMKKLAKLGASMQIGLASADRVFQLLDIEASIKDKADAKELKSVSHDVVLENVSFNYPDGSEALHEVSFNVPAGKTVALVGESGSGKSTILKLIPRFYDVTKGVIKIGGNDVKDVTCFSLRKNIALVSQEIAIFNDSIKDNIAYGTFDATDEEIIKAAKLAAADEFIAELPEGYDTVVGEQGVKLSGGQRQRISIARAMLKKASVLLLDEATSALDTTSEKLVQGALEKLQEGKTTIVVAHRLSTIINADVIYVLDNGRIVEQGCHDDLLAKKGIYTRLYGDLLRGNN